MKRVRGWLVYRKADAERNRHYIDFYEKACARRGAEISLRYLEDFSYGTNVGGLCLSYGGVAAERPDFVVMRADVPLFSRHLELMGYPVFNNAYLSLIANDKACTLQVAAAAGLPVPVSCLADKACALQRASELGYPLVIKPRDGHGGQGVLWIDSPKALTDTLADYPHVSFLLQQPVSELGKDLRVYVVGGEIVAAMLRSQERDFRSNYCLGGSAVAYTLSPEEEQLVKKAVSLFTVDFAGFDFMFDKGHMVLNEIEDVVGARMLYHLTDMDVVDLYTAHILRTIAQAL